jgi:GNAT superfamily N-acetyltransferase
LDIPEDKLINDKNHILIVIDNDKKIVACIRYHYLGIFTSSLNEEIFCVDCFCVNKQWRRKGVGDYLLTYLHTYVNNNNIPHSLFLKEGRKLNIIHRPLYSGVYVYRKLNSHIESNYVKSLTVKQAYKLIDMFLELNSNLFVVRNIHTSNQYWKLYKRDTYKVLVCFQDTYQSFQTDKLNHIAWVTAWIESPNMTDKYREEASKELSDMMYPEFDYVWFNKKWTGNDTRWVVDGSFYWYSYQWTTNITINQSYCILC